MEARWTFEQLVQRRLAYPLSLLFFLIIHALLQPIGGSSPNVNPGYKLVNNAAYPQIAVGYDKMFRVLKSLPCDIFLGAHGNYFGLEAKYARSKDSAVAAFVDPEGCKKYVSDKEQSFRTELARQKTAAP